MKLKLFVRDGSLYIRVDWWGRDFHAEREFTESELTQMVDEGLQLDFFVNYCRKTYAGNKALKAKCTCNAYQLENFGCKCGAV
jgi:hypothetical protein